MVEDSDISLDQDVESSESQRAKAQSESEIETKNITDPSEVTGIFTGCGGENADKITLLNQAYQLVYGSGSITSSEDFSPLKEIKTPVLGNTVLHIAARYGNDDVVDMVAKHATYLLFSVNENEDTPLHVAARAGNIDTVEKLLATYANFQAHGIAEAWIKYNNREDLSVEDYSEEINIEDLKELVRKKNIAEGNTMLHEAILCGKKKKGMGANILLAFEPYKTKRSRVGDSLSKTCYKYAITVANHAKQSVLYLAVEAGDKKAVELILENAPKDYDEEPTGSLSPLVAAIFMKRQPGREDMLKIILSKKPNWIHLSDKHGRLALHYAASTGYREGVVELLDKCKCCSIQKDKYGYFPLHLASHGGHLKVVGELLKYCPDPTEMLDSYKRNVLHIAAKSGKLVVVRYILQTTNERHEMIINQKDSRGDTPLHLAIRSCHFETVECLIRDSRVDLGMVNQKKETALDIASALYQVNKSSLRQKLIWDALKSVVAKPSSERVPRAVEFRPSDLKLDEKVYSRTDTIRKFPHRSWTMQTFKDGIPMIS